MVRAPESTPQTSWVLTTMASHADVRRGVGFPHAADPPRPSAGRAYTATLRVLTPFCRMVLRGSSFHLLPCAWLSTKADHHCHHTRLRRGTHRLGACSVVARAPSTGLTLLRSRAVETPHEIARAPSTECPLHAVLLARLVRALGKHHIAIELSAHLANRVASQLAETPRHRVCAADWFSSAPDMTPYFRAEAFASCDLPSSRASEP